MSPETLQAYLNVFTDWLIGMGGIGLAIWLLINGQGTDNVAGSVAAIGAAIQSFRNMTKPIGEHE